MPGFFSSIKRSMFAIADRRLRPANLPDHYLSANLNCFPGCMFCGLPVVLFLHQIQALCVEEFEWQSKLALMDLAGLAAIFSVPRWAIPALSLLRSMTSPAPPLWRT